MTLLYSRPIRFTASRPASTVAVGSTTTNLFTVNGIIRIKSLFGIVGAAITPTISGTIETSLFFLGVGESVGYELAGVTAPQTLPIDARANFAVLNNTTPVSLWVTNESKGLVTGFVDTDLKCNGGTIGVTLNIAAAALSSGTIAWTLEYESVSAGASVTIL